MTYGVRQEVRDGPLDHQSITEGVACPTDVYRNLLFLGGDREEVYNSPCFGRSTTCSKGTNEAG